MCRLQEKTREVERMSLETIDFMIAMGEIHSELRRIAEVLEMMERRQ